MKINQIKSKMTILAFECENKYAIISNYET